VTEATIRKWKSRDSVHDRPHTAHRLQTTLTPAQEAVAVELRRTLLLSLDDLLVVVQEFLNNQVSRSGLHRCLRRHGVGDLSRLTAAPRKPSHKPSNAYEPGYVRMDIKYLPQMADGSRPRYLFVAIDLATRWVYLAIKPNKSTNSATLFLKALQKACPFMIHRLLTDNGREFTDQLFALQRGASRKREFDQLCAALGIEHRLTKLSPPEIHGMVERFNGDIAEILTTHRFYSAEGLSSTLERYVKVYNHELPQSALKGKTPMQLVKQWYSERPDLFLRRPHDSVELDA
jgi:transposase InsO family protein